MSDPRTALIAELRATFLFEECTDEQLQWVAEHGEIVIVPAGESLFTESSPPDSFWVLLDGEVEYSRTVDGRELVLDRGSTPGLWGGWLPQFETKPMPLRERATKESRFLRLAKDAMRHVMAHGFPLTNHLLAGIMSGARSFADTVSQQQKLAALGRLAAGLAHELNNPAAAAKRAASDLRAALRTRDKRAICLVRSLPEEQVSANLLLARAIGQREPLRLDPIARGEREDEVIAWLDDHGIAESWQIGPSLVDVAVTVDDLNALRDRMPPDILPDAISWLEAATAAEELSKVIETSVERISEIVAAVKQYTFMDRDGQQEVDLHDGIDNTLIMLNHALKTGVEVVKRYDLSVPKIRAYGSELNQVWTNLIDNAVDAMNGKGKLEISTGREGDRVAIVVRDNGPGIPPEIIDRVFEPFFTTKGVGDGAGMGLDIVHRVVRRHGGEVRVASRPGDTRFTVWLPLQPPPTD